MFFGWDQDQCALDRGMIVLYPGVRLKNLLWETESLCSMGMIVIIVWIKARLQRSRFLFLSASIRNNFLNWAQLESLSGCIQQFVSKTENHSHVLGTRQQQLTEEVRPLGGYFFFFIFSLSIGDGVWCLGAAGSVHHHHRHHRHPWHQWSNKQGRKLPRCDSYLRNLKRLFTHRHKA